MKSSSQQFVKKVRWADLEGQDDSNDEEHDPWQNYPTNCIDLGRYQRFIKPREEHERHPRAIKPIIKMRSSSTSAAMAIKAWRPPAGERIYRNLWIHPKGDAPKGECRDIRRFQGDLRSDAFTCTMTQAAIRGCLAQAHCVA